MKLRDKVISSVRWMAFTKIAGQLVAWSITIFVIRILSPDDYGVMALAMLPIGFCALLEELGLGRLLCSMIRLIGSRSVRFSGC